jgi:beta-phosphoglucomutase-like phosphatase (HAD superfamily)
VIGDTGADVGAARAAGARPILVPNDVTRRREIEDADEVAPSVLDAVRSILEADRSVVASRLGAATPGDSATVRALAS